MSEERRDTARWAQVGATLFLGLVGLIFTGVQFMVQQQSQETQFDLQEKNRRAQVALQLMSQRELSEIDFRQKMFNVLIAQLLDSEVEVEERVTRLRLFLHNFHDIFNARALFDVLEGEANSLPEAERNSLIDQLVSMAQEVRTAQELLVGANPRVFELREGEGVTVFLRLEHTEGHQEHEGHIHLASDGAPEGHEITIRLVAVRKRAIEVEVTSDDFASETGTLQFEVSYFDAPFTDNTLFPDKHRFAITLQDTDIKKHPHVAKIRVFEFPAHFVTTGYRPTLRESNAIIESVE